MPTELEQLFEEFKEGMIFVLSSRLLADRCYQTILKIGENDNNDAGFKANMYAIAKFSITGSFLSCETLQFDSFEHRYWRYTVYQ